MRRRQLAFILIILGTIFTACDPSPRSEGPISDTTDNTFDPLASQVNNVVPSSSTSLKTIQLGHGFTLSVGEEEDLKTIKTYTYFELKRKNTRIYLDSSDTEYEFGNTLLPLIHQLDENEFEILVEINDRPNKNYSKLFHIKDDVLKEQKEAPVFFTKLTDLDGDSESEYAGFMSQTSAVDHGVYYNPLLYYKLTMEGIVLDSQLTKQQNEKIYSHFLGYQTKDTLLPQECSKRFEEEMKRIMKAGNQ